MAWNDLVKTANQAKGKTHIYCNINLDQQCLKGKRLLKIKDSDQDKQTANQRMVRLYKATIRPILTPRLTKRKSQRRSQKRPEKTRTKRLTQTSKNAKKKVPWPLEVILNLSPITSKKTLVISPTSVAIEKAITQIIGLSLKKKTSGTLGNLHIDDCQLKHPVADTLYLLPGSVSRE